MPAELQQLTVQGLITVYTSGFMLTVAAYAVGVKIGVVISAIRKL